MGEQQLRLGFLNASGGGGGQLWWQVLFLYLELFAFSNSRCVSISRTFPGELVTLPLSLDKAGTAFIHYTFIIFSVYRPGRE